MLRGAAATATVVALTVTAVAVTRSRPDPSTASTAPTGVISPAESAAEPLPTGPPPPPVTSRAIDLQGSPVTVEDGRRTLRSPQRTVDRFSLLGVTWSDALLAFQGDASVRTRSMASGDWSDWQSLDLEPSVAAGDPDVVAGRTRGGSRPLWVGESDGVEVRVASGGKTTGQLPDGLRLTLIDPGPTTNAARGSSRGQGGGARLVDPTESASPGPTPSATEPEQPPTPTAEASPTTPDVAATPSSPSATTSTPSTSSPTASVAVTVPAGPPSAPASMPAYISRAGWSADESLIKDKPVYGNTVNALFVHHTAHSAGKSNDYTCADAPRIVRSIYSYAVTGKMLSDIEYNFLLDKCGTLYEGRGGGVDRPVVGAHTPPFNTNYTAVAVIGDFGQAPVVDAARTKIAQLAAFKLGQYGRHPLEQFTTTAQGSNDKVKIGQQVTMGRVSGHRDVQATVCPGNALYGQLPAIRAEAADVPATPVITRLSGGRQFGASYLVRDAITVSWSFTGPADQISGFEVLIDGRPAGAAAVAARSATVRLTAGRHAVRVRAKRVGGPMPVSAAKAVLADNVAPTFPGRPEVTLRAGSVSAAAVPVTVSWRAADPVGLASVMVTAPVRASVKPSVLSWNTTAKPGRATTWRLQAVDLANNAATASVVRRPTLLAETGGKRAGRWVTVRGNAHLGTSALASSVRNAALSWTFTGRSAALLGMKGPKAGQVHVYLDNKKVATIDLRTAKPAVRQVIWTRAWPAATRHTVKIVVVGTRGRPTVTTDGIVYLS